MMIGLNALVFLHCGFARPRIVSWAMTLPANHCPFWPLFNWRWNAPFIWPPSPSGFDRSLCPVISEAVQVNRDDVAHVGLLQSTGVKLRDDKRLWIVAYVNGSSTDVSAGNAELIKIAA